MRGQTLHTERQEPHKNIDETTNDPNSLSHLWTMESEGVERVEGDHGQFAVREEEGVEETVVDIEGCGQEEGEVGEGVRELAQYLHTWGRKNNTSIFVAKFECLSEKNCKSRKK